MGKGLRNLPVKDADNKIVSLYGRSTTDNKDQRHFYLAGREGLYPCYPKPDATRLILAEGIDAALFTYNELLSFMGHCQDRGVTKRTAYGILCVIRHYCNYLIHEEKRADNPAAGVFIRGLVRKLPANLLNMEELEELYKQYSIQLNVDASKKIMFGLLVYQGLTVGELTSIDRRDIKLKEGKMKIRGTQRANERILVLNASQVIALQQYLDKSKWKEGKLFAGARI